jgi:MFS family permease
MSSETHVNGTTSNKVPSELHPSVGNQNYTLFLLFSAYVLSFIDRQSMSLLVGPIRETFEISDFQFSFLQGLSFALFYSVAGFPLGRLADKYNRRNIIIVSILFWSIMTCATGLATSFSLLFLARAGVAIGEAGLSPSAYSILSDSYRTDRLGYAMSVYKLAVPVGGGLAFLMSGSLYDYYNQLDQINIPMIGVLKPWQATIITLGLPGILMSILLTTMVEPKRTGIIKRGNGSINATDSIPIKEVIGYLIKHKKAYGYLMLGAGTLAIVGFGTSTWYPEFLARSFGLEKSQSGLYFGSIYLVAGSAGILLGPWMADLLRKRGYQDAYIRVVFLVSMAGIIPGTIAPLMNTPLVTLMLVVPAVFCTSCYLGVMAAALQAITPNQMRGQITAIYLFVASILGMTFGTSIVAIFTDFVFRDDSMLYASLSALNAIFIPLSVYCLGKCLPAYRKALRETKDWL